MPVPLSASIDRHRWAHSAAHSPHAAPCRSIRSACSPTGASCPTPPRCPVSSFMRKKELQLGLFGQKFNSRWCLAFVELKLRVCGGKGGFGALLRASKKKVKTTNFGCKYLVLVVSAIFWCFGRVVLSPFFFCRSSHTSPNPRIFGNGSLSLCRFSRCYVTFFFACFLIVFSFIRLFTNVVFAHLTGSVSRLEWTAFASRRARESAGGVAQRSCSA